MKILVCVKQVIDIEQQIDIREDRLWIAENEDTRYHMNYFDEFAVEEAVRIKERLAGVTIDALTMGPARAESTLRRALALGADNAVHIQTLKDGFQPAEETASHIAEFIKNACTNFKSGMISRRQGEGDAGVYEIRRGADDTANKESALIGNWYYDLILFGVMSEDTMQSLTGPMTAAMCGLPCAAAVVAQTLDPENRTVTVVCELAGGLHETVRLPLPAVLTVQSGINQPRYASLSNRLREKSQAIHIITPEATDKPKQRQRGRSVFEPVKTGTGEFIEGSTEEKAAALLAILHQKSLI